MILSTVIIFLLFFLVLAIIYFFHYKTVVKEKRKLEESWGKNSERFRDFNSIEKYSILDTESNCYSLTEQTLTDIDIESLFSYIDRTESKIGQQYLYAKIVNPSLCHNVLKLRGQQSDYFVSNQSIRKSVQFQLHKLEKNETGLIVDFFKNDLVVEKSKHQILLRILTILAIVSTLIFVVYKPVALLMIFLFGINLMIHLVFRHKNNSKLKAIKQTYALIKTVNKIAIPAIPINFDNIPNAAKKLEKFKKSYHFLDFGIPLNDLSSIVFYVLDLLKSFFLIEVHLLNFSYNEIITNKDSLKEYLTYLGQLEVALSVASIKCDKTLVTCVPTFCEAEVSLTCTDLLHPLVDNCIPNSIILHQNNNAFITGSNMSGKSTFLRAVIINSILSQSLNICFAKSFRSPIVKAFSSIKISDNITTGKSYYFEEVNVIHEMVLNTNFNSKNLLIIDEIFKGTNTVERIALSTAILQYLSSPENIVIASSHDIELIDLIGKNFVLFHFTENILNDELHFDHKIKAGPLQTRNAIKILELEGFPTEIVDNAKALTMGVSHFEFKKNSFKI